VLNERVSRWSIKPSEQPGHYYIQEKAINAFLCQWKPKHADERN
jgi:hypothetical protein